MNKINKNIEKALTRSKPIKELISIAEEEYFLGKDKSEILEKFDEFCDSLKDENQIDIILQSMDIIDGWCKPDRDICINNKSEISVKDYLSALNNIKDYIDNKKRKMLQIHYQHKSLSRSELARRAGISNPRLINIEYGKLGHLLCKELHFPSKIEKKQGTPIWRSIFTKMQDDGLRLDNKFDSAIKQLDWIINV
ncbi:MULTISPECIES: hypothetical protein [Spirulina sp. CCY15215]|uniref:hypothetical protein n=1 Tax=Spirulina sp. CCY15215 TaxID=2767591 RepID=UPI0019504FCD|nr:hypothetical protein [Spirulina major]